MTDQPRKVKLKVVEAGIDDVNKGIVRIDSNFMQQIGVKHGDFVEISGSRKTVGIVGRGYPGDIGNPIIRMDGLMRQNSKAGIGDLVEVQKSAVAEADKIVIAPVQSNIKIKAIPAVFKRGLLGRALAKGDKVALGGASRRRVTMSGNPLFDEIFSSVFEELNMGFGLGAIRFMVTDTKPKGYVYVTEKTEVEYREEPVEILEEEKVLEVAYEDIGGLSEEIKKIREMVELPLKHPEIFARLGIEAPKGVLLHGPPGTGKTLLAKAVANETNSNFILINGPEIMGKFYGQSEENIRRKFEEAEKNAPSIIFIDEVDAIASKREESHGEVERRVVAQLLALMDGLKSRGKVVVIAATNIPNSLDPALRRPGRFDREIEVGAPKRQGRLDILKIHTRNMPLSKDVNLDKLAEITHGFVGADVASLTKEAAMIVLRKVLPDLRMDEEEPIPPEVLDKMIITQEDFTDALKVVRPSALREVLVEIPDTKWTDVGGLDAVKQDVTEAVEWPLKHPKAFERMGITPPRGILLYGAPGTGKTLIARAVASECEANFISVKGPSVLSKWVGESEKAVRKIFEKARQSAPCIIFFDEIDSIAPRRGVSADNQATERVVNQLLTEMDGLERLNQVVVIAATNRPDMLDTALLRPGRFDRIILADIPDEKAREQIFAVHSKAMPLTKDVKIKDLAKRTEGYVGADIEAICREAAMAALRHSMKAKEVTAANFEEALKKVPASAGKDVQESYKELQDKFRQAAARQMEEEKPRYFG